MDKTTTQTAANAPKIQGAAVNRPATKSPSLVFNASRMARMVGGLTSVMDKSNNNKALRRNNTTQQLTQSKSGNDLRKAKIQNETTEESKLRTGMAGTSESI